MQDEPTNTPPTAGSVPPVTPPNISEIMAEPGGSAVDPAPNPAWANDLRQLYNSVVEEPLPDSLIALLSQLDAED